MAEYMYMTWSLYIIPRWPRIFCINQTGLELCLPSAAIESGHYSWKYFLFLFKTGFLLLTLAGLEFVILLLRSPKRWDCVPGWFISSLSIDAWVVCTEIFDFLLQLLGFFFFFFGNSLYLEVDFLDSYWAKVSVVIGSHCCCSWELLCSSDSSLNAPSAWDSRVSHCAWPYEVFRPPSITELHPVRITDFTSEHTAVTCIVSRWH